MKLRPNIRLREIAGEKMLVIGSATEVDLTKVVAFNTTAEYLWEAMKGKDFSVDDVAEILIRDYGIDRHRAYNDACVWTESLVKAGLCI